MARKKKAEIENVAKATAAIDSGKVKTTSALKAKAPKIYIADRTAMQGIFGWIKPTPEGISGWVEFFKKLFSGGCGGDGETKAARLRARCVNYMDGNLSQARKRTLRNRLAKMMKDAGLPSNESSVLGMISHCAGSSASQFEEFRSLRLQGE